MSKVERVDQTPKFIIKEKTFNFEVFFMHNFFVRLSTFDKINNLLFSYSLDRLSL